MLLIIILKEKKRMIQYITKDITTVKSGVVAHGTNCLGAMGSGVALAIRKAWQQVYREYSLYCQLFKQPNHSSDELLGTVQTVEINHMLYVANCFTQSSYGRDGNVYADVDAVEECLGNAISFAKHKGLSLYMPKIGCGLGGLNWENDVEPILSKLVEEENVTVFVCDI